MPLHKMASLPPLASFLIFCTLIHVITSSPANDLSGSPLVNQCGGVVTSGLIEYKPPGGYGANERCVWELRTPYTKIVIEDLAQNYQTGMAGLSLFYFGNDGLEAYKFDQSVDDHRRIYYKPAHPAFLMFSSDEYGSGVGFSLNFRSDTTGLNVGWGHENYLKSSPVGSLAYPKDFGNSSYENFERTYFTFVAQVNLTTAVSVTRLHVENGYDYLFMYIFEPYHLLIGGPIESPLSMTGFYSDGVPASLTNSTAVRFFEFRSDVKNVYSGFTFKWSSVPSTPSLYYKL